MPRSLIVFLVVGGLALGGFWFYGARQQPVGPPIDVGRVQPPKTDYAEAELTKLLPLGNPSNALSNPANSDNYLIPGEHFTLSYNRAKGIPNWVAWTLANSDIGDVVRQNDFRPYTGLPDGWSRIVPSDYRGSRYEKGHMCPSGDRSNTPESNSSTFLMTNIAPQTHELNAGPWEKLEIYSRSMARRNAVLHIIAGQYGENGKYRNRVTVPTNFWKIIVVLRRGDSIDSETRIITVDMPNASGIEEINWREYRTTVRAIEEKTGYKFLTSLPAEVREVLSSHVDSR